MKRSLVVLVALLALVFPALAHAEQIPYSPEAEAFYANAISYWGHTPPLCESINKEMETGILTNVDGSVVWGLGTEPLTKISVCTQTVQAGIEPWQLCRVVMHETGHNEGNAHSGDPANIMYPQINRYMVAPGCPDPPPLPEGTSTAVPPTLEDEISARETSLKEFTKTLKGMTTRCTFLRYHSHSQNQKKICWLNLREAHKEFRQIAAEM